LGGAIKMAKVKDLTLDELEYLIERKVLEILGDPDSGLELKDEFKEELRERLKDSSRRMSHEEVIKRCKGSAIILNRRGGYDYRVC
jgi:hypothetical protein